MAARKKTRGRRRNRGRFSFLYVLLSFLLIAAALVVGSVVFFRADTITVRGNSRYTAEEIISAAQVETGDNLFRLNRRQITQRIYTALPYIRDASILPSFPSELIITVTESSSAASIQGPEGWFLLDARGKLLEAGPEALKSKAAPVTGLTPQDPAVGAWLTVLPEEKAKLDGMAALLSALEKHQMLPELRSVDLSASNQITFRYTDRFTVKIPMSCDFDYKIRTLEYVLNSLEENESGLIDLTPPRETHVIPD